MPKFNSQLLRCASQPQVTDYASACSYVRSLPEVKKETGMQGVYGRTFNLIHGYSVVLEEGTPPEEGQEDDVEMGGWIIFSSVDLLASSSDFSELPAVLNRWLLRLSTKGHQPFTFQKLTEVPMTTVNEVLLNKIRRRVNSQMDEVQVIFGQNKPGVIEVGVKLLDDDEKVQNIAAVREMLAVYFD